MKLLVLAALCCSALAMPGGYGYGSSMETKVDSYGGYGAAKAADAYGYSSESRRFVPILKFDFENKDGAHRLHTVSADNTVVESVGTLKTLPGAKDGPVSVSSGSYSFIGDDKKTYSVRWTSDENGFQAFGEHLPTAPPVPAMPEDLRAAFDQAKRDFDRLAAQSGPVAPSPIFPERNEVRIRFGEHY